MEEGKNKIYGGALMIVPLLFILYDLVYKIMLKYLEKEDVELKIENRKYKRYNTKFYISYFFVIDSSSWICVYN